MVRIAVICDSYRNYEGWRRFICRDYWDKFHCVVNPKDVFGHYFSDMIITESAHCNGKYTELVNLINSRIKLMIEADTLKRTIARTKEESQRAEKYKQMLIDVKDLIGCSDEIPHGQTWKGLLGPEFINELEKLR